MKLSKTLKMVIKNDGKKSLTARTIVRLKSSKECNYLLGLSKA